MFRVKRLTTKIHFKSDVMAAGDVTVECTILVKLGVQSVNPETTCYYSQIYKIISTYYQVHLIKVTDRRVF